MYESDGDTMRHHGAMRERNMKSALFGTNIALAPSVLNGIEQTQRPRLDIIEIYLHTEYELAVTTRRRAIRVRRGACGAL